MLRPCAAVLAVQQRRPAPPAQAAVGTSLYFLGFFGAIYTALDKLSY